MKNKSIAILEAFRQAFKGGVYERLVVLAKGAILSPKRRTVSECLRIMGLAGATNYSSYYYAVNGASWSCISLSRILLMLVLRIIKPVGVLQFTLDDSLVRRYGKHVSMKGRYHDAVRSRGRYKVSTTGIRWLSLQMLCSLAWSKRMWSLPLLTIPCLTEKACTKEKLRYRSMEAQSCLILRLLKRWLPQEEIMLLADGGFVSAKFFKQAETLKICLVSRSRSDLCFFDPAAPRAKGKRGPKPKKGKRQMNLKDRLAQNLLGFQKKQLNWYQHSSIDVSIASGTALWYRDGVDPIDVRWFVISCPQDSFKPAFFIAAHHHNFSAQQLAQAYQLRWNCEVTFQELRQHLGLETQRHWSHTAMTRITPLIFGLYTLSVLINLDLKLTLPRFNAAWYQAHLHPDHSFHDLLAALRTQLWKQHLNYADSKFDDNILLIPKQELDYLLHSLAWAA